MRRKVPIQWALYLDVPIVTVGFDSTTWTNGNQPPARGGPRVRNDLASTSCELGS